MIKAPINKAISTISNAKSMVLLLFFAFCLLALAAFTLLCAEALLCAEVLLVPVALLFVLVAIFAFLSSLTISSFSMHFY